MQDRKRREHLQSWEGRATLKTARAHPNSFSCFRTWCATLRASVIERRFSGRCASTHSFRRFVESQNPCVAQTISPRSFGKSTYIRVRFG